MARHRARVRSRSRFKEAPFTPDQMQTLGGALRDSVRDRIRQGFDVNDVPAPPLKVSRRSSFSAPFSRYAKIKVDRYGGKPIRDWWRTGRTLRSLQVLSVSVNRVVIGFTDSVSNFRAIVNNRRHRQFGVSQNDRVNLKLAFHRLLGYRGDLLPETRQAIAGAVSRLAALLRSA